MSGRARSSTRIDLPEWVRRDLVSACTLAPLTPDDRARNLVARGKGGSVSRGCVVLDSGLERLASALADRNFLPIAGRGDCRGDRGLLCGRVLLTARAGHFVEDASSFDIGIVSLDVLPAKTRASAARTAGLFSRVAAQFALCRRRHGFILVLRGRGAHLYADLVD
jgi:hypothetical protein